MTIKTTKIKNGAVILPKELRKSWKGREVFVTGGEDSLIIKRVESLSLSQLRPKLKELGRKISKKDIENSILEVRAKRK